MRSPIALGPRQIRRLARAAAYSLVGAAIAGPIGAVAFGLAPYIGILARRLSQL